MQGRTGDWPRQETGLKKSGVPKILVASRAFLCYNIAKGRGTAPTKTRREKEMTNVKNPSTGEVSMELLRDKSEAALGIEA